MKVSTPLFSRFTPCTAEVEARSQFTIEASGSYGIAQSADSATMLEGQVLLMPAQFDSLFIPKY